MKIDSEVYDLNTQVLEDDALFDEALEICEDLAVQTLNKKKETVAVFGKILKNNSKGGGYNPQIIDSFYKIYEGLEVVKESGRDSIWKFIVRNLYKPYFLNNKFDYVIGNPPWFTYSSIRNEEYQSTLNKLAVKYHVKPEKVANFPHLEIAAIFLAHCSNYFLKENGEIAFVLPRSFFSADHHDNTRKGKAKGFKLIDIWDLNGVSPLFRIPSCVLFAEKTSGSRTFPKTGLPGLSFSGNLPAHNCNLKIALPKLIQEKVEWFYNRQGKGSAFSIKQSTSSNKINYYKKHFKQGATIVPRSFYFVELTQETPPDFDDRIINIKTSEAIKPDAKAPWKDIAFDGRIESRFIFRTALSRSILPFALYKPDLIVLPITVEKNLNNKKVINLHSPEEIRKEGFLNASRWFQNAEDKWREHRTQNNGGISSEDYLNWQNKLTTQDLDAPFMVLYNASAKDANATVIKRSDIDLEFFVESVGYVFTTYIEEEAFYLAAFLNSSSPNEKMKDFQARGLFGD